MGKIWMPGGGGGADLDVVTAGSGDVLAGKVIVGADGEPLVGTMPNRGAVSQTLNAGGSYTVPAGYHNGSGSVTANSLASQTSATASAGHILSGQTAWVNGNRIIGNIASMGGQTITPGSSQQTISCSGKYMNGNIVISAVSKYGVINGRVSSSSSTKYFSGDAPGTLHYIELNPGFTPTCITAILDREGQDSSVYTNYGQFIVSGRGYPAVRSVVSTLTSSSLIIPVYSVGTYNLLVAGYY